MTLTPTEILKSLNIPIHSHIEAAQAVGNLRFSFDLHKYNEYLSKLSNIQIKYDNLPVAQMTFGYLVHDLVLSLNREPIPMSELVNVANVKAVNFIAAQPWHWQSKESNTKITRLEEIRRYIAMFDCDDRDVLAERIADDFDVNKATAIAYLRQLDKDSIESDTPQITPTAVKIKVNKGAEAAKLVEEFFTGTNKAEMLQLIIDKLNTTKGGAQTFFYAALKAQNKTIVKSTTTDERSTQDLVKSILIATPNMSKTEFVNKAIELGIKRTTAQTYYYALTAELGIERRGTNVRGRKKTGITSRSDQVIEIVKQNPTLDKKELIEMLSLQFNVSKISAQSYYYAARSALSTS